MIDNVVNKITNWIGTPASLILHTVLFIGIFVPCFFGVGFTLMLLVLTTLVSLEAIYLSIFIQMTVNNHTRELQEVKETVEDIEESVEEVQESVEEIAEEDEQK